MNKVCSGYEKTLKKVEETLTVEEKESVCWILLSNLNLQEEILDEFSYDSREWVRKLVVSHPNTSISTLLRLSKPTT